MPVLLVLSHRLPGPLGRMVSQWSPGITLAKVSFYLYILLSLSLERPLCILPRQLQDTLIVLSVTEEELDSQDILQLWGTCLRLQILSYRPGCKSLTLGDKELYFYSIKPLVTHQATYNLIDVQETVLLVIMSHFLSLTSETSWH